MIKQTVEIIPDKDWTFQNGDTDPGRKKIMVDGVQWGSITMERCGRNGSKYTFEGIRIPFSNRRQDSDRTSPVVIWSDKVAQRQAPTGVKVAPLDVRLWATACDLIKKKLLISPAEMEAKRREENEKVITARAEIMRAERAKFEAKAEECLEGFAIDHLFKSSGDRDAIKAKIIEAMKWAQSQ
jgi:hypothetical protein